MFLKFCFSTLQSIKKAIKNKEEPMKEKHVRSIFSQQAFLEKIYKMF